ncbi:MAG: DUF1559 domain-containing protein [Planctomycetaceae bacterium]|nr:DUF1559 domain-containing protein [Planctomycetaceae bacterium]
MKRFYYLFPLIVLLTGCGKTDTFATGSGATETANVNAVPMPTEQMLNELGPVNDITVKHLLPDTLLVIFVQPKRLLTSPLAKGNEPILESILSQAGTLIFRPEKIECLLVSAASPAQVPMTFSDPKNPDSAPQTRIIPISRRASVFRFDAPVTRQMILAPFIGSAANDENTINELKHTEGTAEYFDVTPSNIGTPQKAAVGLIDEKTVVFVEGQSDDIRAVFSDTPRKTAALQRLQHTPIADTELAVLTSLEGISADAKQVSGILRQFPVLPDNVVTAVSENLRAVSFSLNVSADTGKPILSMRCEGKNEEGAKDIHSALQGWLINGQTTLASLDDAAQNTLWIPSALAAELLNAVLLTADKTAVTAALNNFDTLVPSIASSLREQQRAAQQAQIQQQRMQQLQMLSRVCAAYAGQNKKFPADINSPEGKPLLSWRVAMLPALGLNDLYQKFKLNEPWDSPANLPLLEQMPKIFMPMIPNVAPPKTVIRFFNSEGTLFSNPDLKPEEIANPQTALLYISVTPQYAVEWTKPDKLAFSAEKLEEVVGNPLLGVTAAGQTAAANVPPKTDAKYSETMQEIEAAVKGLPLPSSKK